MSVIVISNDFVEYEVPLEIAERSNVWNADLASFKGSVDHTVRTNLPSTSLSLLLYFLKTEPFTVKAVCDSLVDTELKDLALYREWSDFYDIPIMLEAVDTLIAKKISHIPSIESKLEVKRFYVLVSNRRPVLKGGFRTIEEAQQWLFDEVVQNMTSRPHETGSNLRFWWRVRNYGNDLDTLFLDELLQKFKKNAYDEITSLDFYPYGGYDSYGELYEIVLVDSSESRT